MRLPRGEDRDLGPLVGEAHRDVHPETLRHRVERGGEVVTPHAALVHVELDPLEEDAGLVIGVLLGVQDVAARIEDELRDPVDEARLVATGDQQDRGRGAQRLPFRMRRTIRMTTSPPVTPMTARPCGDWARCFKLCLTFSAMRLGLVW